MDLRTRPYAHLNDQENAFGSKKLQSLKPAPQVTVPTRRRALGDVNVLVTHPLLPKGKAEVNCGGEKISIKPSARAPLRSYKNITAKVDTRHSTKTITIKTSKEDTQRLIPKDDQISMVAKTNAITSRLKSIHISTNPIIPKLSHEGVLRESKLLIKKKSEEGIDKYSSLPKVDIKDIYPIGKRVSRKSEAYSTELLEIEDIDLADGKSPILMGIYIKDIYNYLMELETKFPIRENHLDAQICMTPKMRSMLIDWLVEVHEQFSLMLETLHMTVAIIDRYLQVVNTVQRKQIQLIGITAMFIAAKYEEMYIPDIRDFVYITDNSYTKNEILRCEQTILVELKYCLGRPLPLHFERRFIKAARVQSKNHQLAKYLIDLSLVAYEMSHYRPSQLAAAAVCLSISVLSPDQKMPERCWTPTLVFYSGYKFGEIADVVRKLANIVVNASVSRYKAVTCKYNSSKHGKVPSYPELRCDLIKSIAGQPSPL